MKPKFLKNNKIEMIYCLSLCSLLFIGYLLNLENRIVF